MSHTPTLFAFLTMLVIDWHIRVLHPCIGFYGNVRDHAFLAGVLSHQRGSKYLAYAAAFQGLT